MDKKGPTYRFEIAGKRKAGCQNSKCKKEGIKIEAGELRFGVLVTLPESMGSKTSWSWKHWGCVTPAQVANMQLLLEGLDYDDDKDMDCLDGFEDLPVDAREKVRRTVKQGHVDDEDWKGEPELNRPGMKGINKRTPKKKDPEDGEEAEEGTPITAKAKRGKKQAPAEDDEEEATQPKKKASKKRKAEQEEEADVDAKASKKAKARGKKVKTEDPAMESDLPLDPEPKAKATKAKATKARKVKTEEAAPLNQFDGADELGEEIPSKPPKAQKARKVKAESATIPVKEEYVDELGDDEVLPTPAMKKAIKQKKVKEEPVVEVQRESKRGKKGKKEVVEDELDSEPAPKRSKRKGKAA